MFMNVLRVTTPESRLIHRRAVDCSKSLIVRWALLPLLALTLLLPVARAQVTASIRGGVTDASGAPVAQAGGQVNNLETTVVRAINTHHTPRVLLVAPPL